MARLKKILRMFAEYGLDCLWDETGDQLWLDEELKLPPAIVARFKAWNEWSDELESYLPSSHRTADPPFPLEAFNTEGRAIAALIQSELPDWTVVYTESS